jgi:hypothetical protein
VGKQELGNLAEIGRLKGELAWELQSQSDWVIYLR